MFGSEGDNMNLAEEIAAKAAALPLSQQRQALAFVEELARQVTTAPNSRTAFRSIEGLIPRQIERLEEDLAEIRREMWQNFPRAEPK
jgi:hypothetical protein